MPFGHGLYLAIKNNPYFQAALVAAIALKLWWLNNLIVSRRATRRYKDRATIKRLKVEAEAIEEITEIKEEASNEADQAIAAGRAGARSGILSDAAIARTLGRNGASTGRG